MIDLKSGFAPAKWQQGVGTVTVARQDRKPLTKLQLEMVWSYCDAIIERFGDGEGPPNYMYSEVAFQGWCREYKREALLNGRKQFESVVLPL
ncbi:hypothetical protein FRC02_005957 [Tulasnella sp. 418]|nr:hypothetical protein FRC02_005957 [Tulasnella sp. 418]